LLAAVRSATAQADQDCRSPWRRRSRSGSITQRGGCATVAPEADFPYAAERELDDWAARVVDVLKSASADIGITAFKFTPWCKHPANAGDSVVDMSLTS
jgi:hypothetical protein